MCFAKPVESLGYRWLTPAAALRNALDCMPEIHSEALRNTTAGSVAQSRPPASVIMIGSADHPGLSRRRFSG